MIYRFCRALLFVLPAEIAHHLGLWILKALSAFPSLCARLRRLSLKAAKGRVDLSTRLGKLEFPHPIGLAAGFDKDGVAIPALFGLGFACVEVGTLTPRPQPGNAKPRLFRIPEAGALVNRMGFNNAGAVRATARLSKARPCPAPLGVNIGKNKDTPLERAADDYVQCIQLLAPVADYVVVNASSPNTPGLRSLQEPARLAELLTTVRQALDAVAPKPLLLKIAPDLAPEAVDEIVDIALASRLDGLIATNTTVSRPLSHPRAQQSGGLSGRPLRGLAQAVIRRAHLRSQGRLPIVGVGGIFSAEDAYDAIRAGASLVQLYTGFIYGGPGVVSNILKSLEVLLQRDGFSCLRDAIGADERTAGRASSIR